MVESNDQAQKKSKKLRIGITHGDFNGISYEIILKAFADGRMLDKFVPIIYGSAKIASYHKKTLSLGDTNFNMIKFSSQANPKKVNLVNIFHKEAKIELGKSSAQAGELALLALEMAVKDLKQNSIDVLVTAPINKHNIRSEEFNFPGHTEYLAEKFKSEDYLMLMISDIMKLGVVTGHIPLSKVPEVLTSELILEKIRVLNQSLKMDFLMNKPRIAILGLNPHAGDAGVIGDEEERIIQPAIDAAREEGCLLFGPYPADGFFASDNFKNFDAILAMYHDQGLIPFKAMAYDKGVNYTAGLQVVRTSPAHGTAYEIAGKDLASPESLRQAIYLAREIYENRHEYLKLTKNPLPDHLSEILNNYTDNSGKASAEEQKSQA
jgi:4-hydroxythreonine-4-phosphate dehydrogenase